MKDFYDNDFFKNAFFANGTFKGTSQGKHFEKKPKKKRVKNK